MSGQQLTVLVSGLQGTCTFAALSYSTPMQYPWLKDLRLQTSSFTSMQPVRLAPHKGLPLPESHQSNSVSCRCPGTCEQVCICCELFSQGACSHQSHALTLAAPLLKPTVTEMVWPVSMASRSPHAPVSRISIGLQVACASQYILSSSVPENCKLWQC